MVIEGSAKLSDKDGAGGIYADRADNVVTGRKLGGGIYSCTSPNPVISFYLVNNTRTRVAFVWDTDPAYSGYVNRPSADLDISIYSPTGAWLSGSYSWDNTYEIVDFIPKSGSGTYTLRVNKIRCDLDPDFYGWAMMQGN